MRHRLGPETEVNVLFMEQRPSQQFRDSHEAAFEFTTLLLEVLKRRWTCVALSLALLSIVITANEAVVSTGKHKTSTHLQTR